MSKFCFSILVIIFLSFNAAAQSESINWQKDYKAALAVSRETGKPILIDFWAKWCKPCLVMDEKFWTRADVVEAVKSFVPLKLDYDAEKNLASHFVVRGLPYVAFSDPFGNLVAFRQGFGTFTAEDIKQVYNEMPKDYTVLNKAFSAYELKKTDSAALLEIAGYYERNKMPIAGGRYYKLAFDTPDVKRDAAKKETVAAKIGQQFYAAGSFYHARFAFEDYLKLFPDGANKESVYAILINVYVYIGKLDEADKTLEKLKAEFPASKNLGAAVQIIENAKKEKDKETNQ